MHGLRHTAVAMWIDNGASPHEVAARAGHRSVVTVLDRYGHLFPSTEQRLNDKLDAAYTAVLDEAAGAGQVIDRGRWVQNLAACSRPRCRERHHRRPSGQPQLSL